MLDRPANNRHNLLRPYAAVVRCLEAAVNLKERAHV